MNNNPLSKVDADGHQQEPVPAREEIESEAREDAEMVGRAQSALRQANADEFNRRTREAGATGPALSPDQVENAEAAGVAKIHEMMGSYGYKSNGEPPQLAAGKAAHENEEVRPGEQKEVRTPSGKRMDRYDGDKAHIREIKPDNPRGERNGQRQLTKYKTEMDNATGRPHTTELTKYPNNNK